MSDKVNSVESFVSQLPRLNEKMKGNYFYRGQSDESHNLTPSVLRGSMDEKEHEAYMQILTECAHEFEISMTHNEILSKMQHYGVPTRLLDITTNALVALYFACDGDRDKNKDGAVFVLKADKAILKQYDSDTVSILACLPRFTKKDKDKILNLCESAGTEASNHEYLDSEINDFNSNNSIRRLLHEIKKEKPAFENIINPCDLLKNYYFIPRKCNPRIIRQNGAFIIFGLGEKEIKIEDCFAGNMNRSYKIIIDKDAKHDIINQLSCFGISKATLHPELYKVAEYVKDTYREYMRE